MKYVMGHRDVKPNKSKRNQGPKMMKDQENRAK